MLIFFVFSLASQSSGHSRSPNLVVNPNEFLADSDTDAVLGADSDTDALFGYVLLNCKNAL